MARPSAKFLLQIPHGLAWDRKEASEMRVWRLTIDP
jgi:hypothetical protein